MYDKILASWISGTLTEYQIDLLVRTKWLTAGQAVTIKATPKL